MGKHRVVVIGGGFGGLRAVEGLRRQRSVEVTLVDRRNFNLFQPLLYQVATGELSSANIATPLRVLLRDQRNARVVMAEATGFDLPAHQVRLDRGSLTYDTLVVAAGSCPSYFGNPGWEAFAPGLKTVEDAERIRRRIFTALEAAEVEPDPARRAELLCFVIIGGGATSVELAGAVAEITRHTLRREFRAIDPTAARIILIEADDRLLGQFTPASSAEAARALATLGVQVRLRTRVVDITADGVRLRSADGESPIAAATVLWGAGVQGSPLGRSLAEAAGLELARGGRLGVGDDCTLPGHPEIFVIGDLAAFSAGTATLPGVAQVALQQGAHVAATIAARLAGKTVKPFAYRDLGSMATIGRRLAVVEIGSWRLRGRLAWLTWLGLHLMKLIRVESRLLVLIQWAWSYATWNRNARLITGSDERKPP